ncbi:CRTAC1 family protein [Thalassoglobus sp.]|uniref:CRTAC1 family protein n=1 Tax=Thalassoglobus sp. TaxID=2795869 RepID=UPI003AA99E50
MTQNIDSGDVAEEQDDAIVGAALKWSVIVFVGLGLIAGPVVYFMTRPLQAPPAIESELAAVEVREVGAETAPPVSFADITETAGIDFVHESGARGQKLLPESMGGGCAFFDMDNDGDQDLLLINSQSWEEFAGEEVKTPSLMGLYRNDGSGQFENVTSGSGLDVSMYGMGVACGDYNGDGLVDVYISAVGKNRLFRNEGNGKFLDVTESAKVSGAEDQWGTSCGWFDYDGDGDLDLFVCNYVKWSQEYDLAQDFQLTGGDRAYGRPQNFEGTFPYLFRNEGDGTFSEVAEEAGLQLRNRASNVPMAKSLGVIIDDFNRDGWMDMLVANDTVQNFLFLNNQDGTFMEVGTLSGVAFDMDGTARGAMGIDVARFRNNDSLGVAIGNFSNEMTALYVAEDAAMQFVDEAISSGLGPTTRLSLTFGVFFFDYDLDGRLDLFTANGHLEQEINRVQPSQFYEQPPQLFWNCGHQSDTEFLLVAKEIVGEDFAKPLVGRGASYADIDNDGDLDILIATTGQKPRLLRNDQELMHNWIRFWLQDEGLNRNAIGALVELEVGESTLHRRVTPTKSYQSQSELPVTFGLGESSSIQQVRVTWPDGTVQVVKDFELNSVNQVRKAN